jgi:hypothetical protein
VSTPGTAWTVGEQIFAVPRILQNIGRIERTPPRACTRDPFLTLAFLFRLRQPRCFFDLALQLFHLPAQLFLLFGELVFFR